MIRNSPGASSYFGGGYQQYGRYQWNVKYYGFENDLEIEDAQFWALGEHVRMPNGGKGRHFESLSEIVGRPVEAYLGGRSGGWLYVETELTDAELAKIDAHVKACMKALPEFLKEQREFRASEAKAEADAAETARIEALAKAPETIRLALERAETALQYGPDMASSKVVALEDAIGLLSGVVQALKGAPHV